MSKSYYFKDQNVFAEDLNNTENSRIEDIKNRIQALLGNSGGIYNDAYSNFSIVKGGVFGRPDEYDQNKNLKVAVRDSSTLFIYPGDAIDASGNPIKIESTKTVELGGEDANYIWTPTTGMNYVKIRYVQSSGSVGLDDQGNQYYTRYYDSYYIEVNGIHPSGSVGNPILLATFTGLGDGSINSGTLFDRRLYTKIITLAGGVIIDPFNNPVPSQITAADHFALVGTGTPSPTNPHGLSITDIGGSLAGDTAHKVQAHINGIIHFDNDTPTLDSFKGTVINNNSPSAAINFAPPSNALLAVGGEIISGSLPPFTGADAYAIAGNGRCEVFAYKDGTIFGVTYTDFLLNYYDDRLSSLGIYHTTGHKQPDYYYLGECTVSAGGNTLVFTDQRTFNTTHPRDIIADFSNAFTPPSSLPKTADLVDNLKMLRYQIGIAIGGHGQDWNNSTSKNTDGSNADSLHKHSHNKLDDIVGTTATAANLVTLTNDVNADSLHKHSHNKLDDIVGTTATAANLVTLTNGSNADSLHKHSHDNLDDITATTATAANLITLTNDSNADSLHKHSHDNLDDITATTATAANLITLTNDSNADSLHKHSHDNLDDITATTATAANLITLTNGSNADSLHTHAPVPFQGSAFKLKLPQTVDTTGGSAILTWTSGSVNTYDYLNMMNDVAGSGSIFLLDDGFYHIDVLVHGTPDSDSGVTNVELILNIGASEIYNQKQGYSGAVNLLRSSFSLSTDIRIEAPTNGFTINVLVTSGGTYQHFTAGDGRFSIRKLSDL